MKINTKLLLLGSTILSGCTTNLNPTKISINLTKVENGGLITKSVEEIKNDVITNRKDYVLLLTVENCSACQSAKDSINNTSVRNNYNVVYISITAQNYPILVEITSYNDENYHNLPKEVSESKYPRMYLFKDSFIVTSVETKFSAYLDAFISAV